MSSAAIAAQPLTSFNELTHEYHYRGVRVLSVTESIKAAGLIDCSWYTDEARQRGRAVHLATQYDDEGTLDESTVSDLIRPYLEAKRNFMRDTGFVVEMNESQVWQIESGYAGTLDRFGRIGRQPIVLDWKSGAVQEWVRLQLAAYANGLPNGAAALRYGVQLKPDKTYKIFSFPPSTFRTDLNDFLACVRVAQLQREGR